MSALTVALPPDLLAATEALAEQLLHAEPIVRYHQAQSRLDVDAQARALLDRLSAAQAELRARQSRGQVTQDDINRLRALQGEARSNPIIVDYATAQQAASAYLAEVNQAISRLLGVDFASLAGPASC